MGSLTVNQADIVSISIVCYGPWYIECKLTGETIDYQGNSGTAQIEFTEDDFPYVFNLSDIYNTGTNVTKIQENSNVKLDIDLI